MRRRLLLTALPALVAARLTEAAEPARVVASFSILADMTSVVGGDAAAVTELVGPDGDVHTFEPRPGDLRVLRDARVLVENGLGLEGWMTRLSGASGFAGVTVISSAGVQPRTMQEHGARVTDPHAWQDPHNAVVYVRNIAEGLARAVPGRADDIRGRADAYIKEIEAVDEWIVQALVAIPPERRKIITSHDAFGYYGARFGVTIRGIQGISTENEATAHDITALAAQIRREKIRAVFVENMTDPRIASVLAKEAGASVGGKVYSDALSPAGGPADTYVKMLRHNTQLFAQAMAAN